MAAWATSKYSKIEDSTKADNGGVGWGSCVDCAGGGSNNASIASSPFLNPPSKDGASRDFYISGEAYSNALWWYKVGANNATSHFTFDFWLNVDASTTAAQALEFDTFQFVQGRQFMFGTQCNYAAGVWDLWNAATGRWVHSNIGCSKFTPGVWYHITMSFHRSAPDNYQHYDKLSVTQYNARGRLVSSRSYNLNRAYPSGVTPAGWGDNLGVQFQMDIGAAGAQMQEWVDQVSLTAW
jgi:hypothetical protein